MFINIITVISDSITFVSNGTFTYIEADILAILYNTLYDVILLGIPKANIKSLQTILHHALPMLRLNNKNLSVNTDRLLLFIRHIFNIAI